VDFESTASASSATRALLQNIITPRRSANLWFPGFRRRRIESGAQWKTVWGPWLSQNDLSSTGLTNTTVYAADLNRYAQTPWCSLRPEKALKSAFTIQSNSVKTERGNRGPGEVCIAEPGLMATPNAILYAAYAASRGHDVSFENQGIRFGKKLRSKCRGYLRAGQE
jgi:hypothetical protein